MVSMVKKSILVLSLLIAQAAVAQKTVPWAWKKSDCQTCGISFKLVGNINAPEDMDWKEKSIRYTMAVTPAGATALNAYDKDATVRTLAFIHALSTEKETILKLYNSDPQEYNLLATIAVGILGQETRFFANYRYFIKRNSQYAIEKTKDVKAWWNDQETTVANSKGPTQIKNVPDRIAQHYNINEKNLWNPKSAAVSTMGYLIEALVELKQRAKNNNLEMITDDTYVDYLPYIYFGGSKKLVNRTATPDKNIYVKNMKRFMKKVAVSEVVK